MASQTSVRQSPRKESGAWVRAEKMESAPQEEVSSGTVGSVCAASPGSWREKLASPLTSVNSARPCSRRGQLMSETGGR